MTPRQRVEIALRGGRADKVPFTIYENKIPQCAAEREMRNRGLCIVHRQVPAVKSHRPNVTHTQQVYWEDGKRWVKDCYQTPVGTLTTLAQAAGFTNWVRQKLFKTPDDYKALMFFIADEQYEPNYEAFAAAQRDFGDDMICRAGLGLSPMQALISGQLMGMQTFCIEWMDNRDEILKLYEAIREKRRQLYPLVAESPALFANYCGNVSPAITSGETFERYYLPNYQEAAEVMHAHGKLVGVHLDADNKPFADAVARSELDYIEAFCPAPSTDMTLAEGRAAWPDKVLWLNFPPVLHLKSDAQVERATVDLLNEIDSIDGLLMGITEDIPPSRWRDSCRAIMSGLERHAAENPSLYA